MSPTTVPSTQSQSRPSALAAPLVMATLWSVLGSRRSGTGGCGVSAYCVQLGPYSPIWR